MHKTHFLSIALFWPMHVHTCDDSRIQRLASSRVMANVQSTYMMDQECNK